MTQLRRKQMRQAGKRWRERNRETMSYLNSRNKRAYRLMVEWVRNERPDIYELCRNKAKQEIPLARFIAMKEGA